MNIFLYGFMISGGLIVAIGAQNAFVLRQGLLKQNVGIIVLLCWLCDVVLMSCGVLGIGALLASSHSAAILLSLAGALFLLTYGALSAKRAYQGGGNLTVDTTPASTKPSVWKAASTTLALTLLNPHVYVDTVMLVGGSAATLSQQDKMPFLLGTIAASGLWFSSLGYGARLLRPLFRRERTWQLLDSLIALMMFYLAYTLIMQAWASYTS